MVLYITNSQIVLENENVENLFSMDHYSYSLVWNQQMRDELVKVIDTELSLAEDRLDLISNEHQWVSVLSICKDLKINYKNLHSEIEVNGIYIERALEYLSLNPDAIIENLLTHETFDSLYEKMQMLSNTDKEDLELKNKILITLSRLNELVKLLQINSMNSKPNEQNANNESGTLSVPSVSDLIPRKSATPPLHKMIYLSKLLSLKHFKDEYFYNTAVLISSILSNKKKIANYVEDLDREDALTNIMIHLAREQLISFYYSDQGNTVYMETEGLRRILSLVYILGELLNFKPRRMLDIVNNPNFINVIVMNLSLSSNKTEKLELIWQSVFLLHTLLDSPLYNSLKLRQTIQKTGVFEYLLVIILNMEEHSTKCLTAIVNFLKAFHVIPLSTTDQRQSFESYSFLRYFLPSQLLKLLASDKERDVDLFISALTKREYSSPFLIWNGTHRSILKNSLSKRLKVFDEKRKTLSKQVAEWQQTEPTKIAKVIFSSSITTNYLYTFEEPEIISYQDLDEKLSINDIFVEAFVNLQPGGTETDEDASINELEYPDVFLLKLVEALQKEQKYRNIELIIEAQTKLYLNFSLGKYTTPSQGHSPHFLKYQGYPILIRKYQGLLEDLSDDSQRIRLLNLFVRLIASQLEPEPEISYRNKLLFLTSGGLIFISEYIIKNSVCRNDEQLMINTLRVLDSIADILMPLISEDEEEKLIPINFFDIFVPLLDTKYIESRTEVSLRTIHCIRKYVRHLQNDNNPMEKVTLDPKIEHSVKLIHNRWPLILQLINVGFIFKYNGNSNTTENDDHTFIKTICITALEIIHNLLSLKIRSSFETLLEKLLLKNMIETLMQIGKRGELPIFDKIKTFDDFYNLTRSETNHILLVWNENLRSELLEFIDLNIHKNNKELTGHIEKFSYTCLKSEGMFKLLDTNLDIYPTCLISTWKESNLLSLSEFLQSIVDPAILNSTNLIQSLITSLHSLLVVEYQQKMITKETLRPLAQQITLLKLIVCQDSSKNLSSETSEQTLIFLNTSYQQVILHIYHLLIGYLANLTKDEEFMVESVNDILEIIIRISKFFSKYSNKIGEDKTKEFYQFMVATMHKFIIYYYKGCNNDNSLKEEALLLNIFDHLITFFKTLTVGTTPNIQTYCVGNGLLLSVLHASIKGGIHQVQAVRLKSSLLLSTLVKLSIPSVNEVLDQMLFPSFASLLGQGQLEEFIKQFDEDVVNPEVWWDGRDRDLVREYLSEHINLASDYFFMGTHLEDFASNTQSKFNANTEKGYKLGSIYLTKLNEMPTYQFTLITNHQFIEMVVEKLSSLCAKYEESNINNTEERKTIWKTAYAFIQNHSLYKDVNSTELSLEVEQSLLLLLELFCRELVYITQSEEKHDMFVINLLCFLTTFVKKYPSSFIQFLNNFSDFTTILLRVANNYRSILRSVIQVILDTVGILTKEKTGMSQALYESILEQVGSELNIAYLFLFIMNKVQASQCVEVLISISKIDDNLVPYLKESWFIPETFFTSSEHLLESLANVNDEFWNDEKRTTLTQKSEEIIKKFEAN
ncbi:hypothetical protein NAEGRDRAFT_78816 [Naegleria gruberi]|uniref:Uncharacterized protein n=1 Tax=Naegleria gruberi TaxID=5762 RepID=D2V6S1_NAEGR|nr:uncharacterized protein NAEGRDRAFT_78816 [Naegleria gruberi]EFC47491.1 hypothetical protein NAEGRDRAFT_78816 [Naegleria gruberi]|eukprot:XP_002680235.1 hypothetical protein NAEGRDRAFT_78816 [Naegleria gruberi strain NEG-M]